jgi:sn-glycerol 3-phosphate transport system substrate-binding protein
LLGAEMEGLKVAFDALGGKTSPPLVRVSQIEPVRTIVEEELESVWEDKKPAKQALDDAVRRGNAAVTPVALARGAMP